MRTFPMGIGVLQTTLEEKFNLGPHEAEELILNTHIGNTDPFSDEQTQQLIQQFVERMLTGIRRILISFEDSHNVEIEEVFICGGGSELNGLQEVMEEDLGCILDLGIPGHGRRCRWPSSDRHKRKSYWEAGFGCNPRPGDLAQ